MAGFLGSSKGRVFGLVFTIAALGSLGWVVWSDLKPDPALAAATDAVFINAQTGYVFHAQLKIGLSFPMVCPDTGKPNGYPAEFCYWTKDGHVKSDPTAVLLNIYRGKAGPTFCPDCGRLVVAQNPAAAEGHRPPPTEAEYRAGGNRNLITPR